MYGRKTGQFKINPFDIFTTKKMLSKVNNEDLLVYYGITDGIPQYLSFIDQTKSVEENIQENQNAPLQNEPNVLLQEELRKPATYFSILNALAHGKSKSTQISQAIGMNNGSSISAYLNNLIELEIIERKQPIFESSPRKAIYAFKDNMFKFWFKFIAEAQDQIALERTKGILKGIMDELPHFGGQYSNRHQWIGYDSKKTYHFIQRKLPVGGVIIQLSFDRNKSMLLLATMTILKQ